MKWVKDLMIEKQLGNKTAISKKRDIKVPKDLKSVGILANNQEEFYTCKGVLRERYQYKIKIIGYYYHDHKNKETSSNEAVNHKNFSVMGKATDFFNNFTEEKFDCILVPTTNLNPYLLSLLSTNPTGFRIGFYSSDQANHLDLMIEKKEGTDLGYQINELLMYLNKIN
jgi:hypothetical protein